ncbi:mitochondrial peptidyl-tRNA hydrolase [Xylariaceae sp. FL0255]|nr:mitochondrial peptidyl-tRNA hydrolase [Xylariaceae sp. FL0255]
MAITHLAPRLLVVSIGNQAPYYECLHSAGHFALIAATLLEEKIGIQPKFTPSNRYGKKCLASEGHPYTFLQSPTMMNNCGPFVLNAWKSTLKLHDLQPSQLGLVIVHDELEADLGSVLVRDWDRSHRGHNGIKSIKASMQPPKNGNYLWKRICVGIGRPTSREPNDVANYVLRKMSPAQRSTIDTKVGDKIYDRLREIEVQWEENQDS